MFILEIDPSQRGINLEILEGNETLRRFVEELAKDQNAIQLLEGTLAKARETRNASMANKKS